MVAAAMSEAVGELDHRHLWHPFTQQRDWCQRGAARDRARRGHRPDRLRRAALHRRRLVAVVQRPRPSPSADRRGGARAARPGRPLDDARASPTPAPPSWPRGWSSSPRPGSSASSTRTRARRATEIALKMAFQYWQPARRAARAAHLVRLPARRLPRRHPRGGVGRRHRPLPRRLLAAAVPARTGSSPGTPASSSACSTSTPRRSPR